VVTRQQGWQADGAVAAAGVPEALALAGRLAGADAEIWVMGGAQIYAAALPLADRVLVTELEQAFEGDARAPELGTDWQLAHGSEGLQDETGDWLTSRNGLRYRFRDWRRAG